MNVYEFNHHRDYRLSSMHRDAGQARMDEEYLPGPGRSAATVARGVSRFLIAVADSVGMSVRYQHRGR